MVLANIILTAQSTYFKLKQSTSKDSGIFIDSETFEAISPYIFTDDKGRDAIKLVVYRDDCIRALGNIMCSLPLLTSKSGIPREVTNPVSVYDELNNAIFEFFGTSESRIIESLYFSELQNRKYLWGTEGRRAEFELRKFFVSNHTELIFESNGTDELHARFHTHLVAENKEEYEPADILIEIFNSPLNEPLQQIFFGAPGTGKSFKINEMCAKYENYRTTFHPDTDYASFVGSYKPITEIVTKYDQHGNSYPEKRIVYTYVYQAFLQAYIAAWKEQQNNKPQPVFLVVEEINRGNCAQIFGDIFQLLDRNEEGFSDYPINADKDLEQELHREFKNWTIVNRDAINTLYKGGKDVVGEVMSGKKLLLPNNLYIWATMNTSDQSLFPIDSAFKRRWDWKYIKIKDNAKDYKIVFSNGNVYDWWQFVETINDKIENGEIQQEDKKLGYFFAKSKNGRISAERFLSKVIFYLYNDVFKDFGFDEDFFKGADDKPMTFASYFDEAGEANEDQIERFLTNLGLQPIGVEDNINGIADDQVFGLTINGRKMQTITQAVFEILSVAAKSDSFEEISDTVANIFTDRDDVIKTIDNPDTYTKENRWNKTPIIANDGTAFVVSNQWLKEYMPQVKELAESFNVPFDFAEDEAMSSDDGDDDDVASSKALTVKWPDGTFVNEGRKNTYVKTLEMMGIERVAEALKGRFRLGDVPIVSKESSPKIENHNHFRYEKVGDYYVIVSLSNAGSILRSLSKKFGLDLTVTGR